MAEKPKAKKASKGRKVFKAYAVEADRPKRLRRSCPKCGQGTFLAKHKDRESCGRCGYTEFQRK
ncbi:MAG TPA: 30S ribosomal protein S27ae [Candidatus Nanoarchaeia archaeon]|nr:30S ribosomal protein S27ae [Candidatus Nanoarchaeia archaeon]